MSISTTIICTTCVCHQQLFFSSGHRGNFEKILLEFLHVHKFSFILFDQFCTYPSMYWIVYTYLFNFNSDVTDVVMCNQYAYLCIDISYSRTDFPLIILLFCIVAFWTAIIIIIILHMNTILLSDLKRVFVRLFCFVVCFFFYIYLLLFFFYIFYFLQAIKVL